MGQSVSQLLLQRVKGPKKQICLKMKSLVALALFGLAAVSCQEEVKSGPNPDAEADPWYGYYGYRGYYRPYGYRYWYGKRSADAEPTADAAPTADADASPDADAWYGYYGYHPYAYHGYYRPYGYWDTMARGLLMLNQLRSQNLAQMLMPVLTHGMDTTDTTDHTDTDTGMERDLLMLSLLPLLMPMPALMLILGMDTTAIIHMLIMVTTDL